MNDGVRCNTFTLNLRPVKKGLQTEGVKGMMLSIAGQEIWEITASSEAVQGSEL